MRDRPAGGTEAELGISARKCTGSRQERFCGREDASAHDCACRKSCDRDLHRKMHGLDARCPYGERRGPTAEPPTATVVSLLVPLFSVPLLSFSLSRRPTQSFNRVILNNSNLSLRFGSSTLPHASIDVNRSKNGIILPQFVENREKTKQFQKFQMFLALIFGFEYFFFLSCPKQTLNPKQLFQSSFQTSTFQTDIGRSKQIAPGKLSLSVAQTIAENVSP